jgi:AcrR family transcriptional regulator
MIGAVPDSERSAGRRGAPGGRAAGTSATSAALSEAGHRWFARSGYAGARLADIVADAGVTTGALYGHFASKSDFFNALFAQYGEALQSALDECSSLDEQLAQWIAVSRRFRGVVRASAEILLRVPEHAAARRELRDVAAGLLAWRLREPLTQRDARLVARLLVDVLDQYVWMEASGALPEREPDRVAQALQLMVRRGVYLR